MRLIFFILIFFSLHAGVALAIKFSGSIVDVSSGEPICSVSIKNLNTGTISYSDVSGNFSVTAHRGDSLSCSIVGYEGVIIPILADEPEQYRRITLKREIVMIDTVVIRSLTAYQQDWLDRRAIYGNKVDQRPVKFRRSKKSELYGGAGQGMLNFDAPISVLIPKRTRKYKRLKAFQDRFKNDERQSYIDSRYTLQLVTDLTGLTEDSLALFMKTLPVTCDYSRAATELELKMWVKYNYRTWTPSPGATKQEE